LATFLSCLPSKASFPWDTSSVNVPNSLFISPILFTSIGISIFPFSVFINAEPVLPFLSKRNS